MQVNYRQELIKLIDILDLPRVVCECGCAEGWFTKDILKWNLDKLYLVDAWRHLEQSGDGGYPQEWHDGNYAQIVERVKPFGEKVVILKGLSHEMANEIPNESLGLAYIDADHSYLGCKRDLNCYFDKVVKGGIVSGHDFLNESYGVRKAVEEFCAGRFEINVVPDEEPAMASFWFIKM